jgi:hypothetical protein
VACTPHGGNVVDRDFWVFEVKDTTVNINEDIAIEGLKVYPNPAKDYVVFEFGLDSYRDQGSGFGVPASNNHIKITNIFGQEVARIDLWQEVTVWDCRAVEAGVYFYNYNLRDQAIFGKIIVSK